jgi:two-component system chemotaxis response regulator CheY
MKSCLIVDDSRVIRKVARQIFESLDFNCEEAEHGKLALDACQRTMPNVILLDWNMPVMVLTCTS